MWTSQVAGAKLVVVRRGEVSTSAGRRVKQPAGGKEDWKRKDNGGQLSFLLPFSLLPTDQLNGL